MNNLIIIPALNPDDKLDKLVNELHKNEINNILVVDDGSTNKDIFKKLEANGVIVVHHEKNMGKGAAIKTALWESEKYFKNIKGFITADADGQHSPSDIANINKLLKDEVIFGVRNFKSKNVPLKSRIGNLFSSIVFLITTGIHLSDTQTGLRAFPIEYKALLLSTKGDRFEYEMNVLNRLAKENITILKVPIKTIYENKNKGSNFKVFKDSLRIYKSFFISILIIMVVIVFTMLLINLF